MTVTYTAEVATCKKFGCFIKLLARWRGSIYKIIWMDLLLFLTLYYCINFIYLYLLEEDSKATFESIVYYCDSYTSLIPLSFVLGFYVNLVMSRWWEQYVTIPWPDSIAVYVSAHVHGQDEGGRLMRRTVMRYVCLCLTIVFTMISPCVKKRFPKMKNLVDAGLLLENEKNIIEAMDTSFPNYPKHWLPIVWAASIITRARKEGRIRDDFAVKTIIDELNSFRGRCGTLMYFDFISIPLVYTQVVTIAVYSFFVCSLLAHQWTDSKKDTYEALDFYSPVFITLQFFFYMGWLKVAETLINPFGEDDDDFEVNWMIDRNLQVSYLIVDEMHHEHPELVRDQYWDDVYPNELPYESEVKREYPPEPSTAKYDFDTLNRATSKPPSQANSTADNRKSQTSLQSAFNGRSQRFNEAFQRFLNYSEDDASSLRVDVENSLQSLSDIENVQRITSYVYSDQTEFDSQEEIENFKDKFILETIREESEKVAESIEEEATQTIDDEDDNIESESSHENDSESDTFEQLRVERQQQRLQRMNDYLERHFGANFRIVTQPSTGPETKSNIKAEDVAVQNNKEKDLPDTNLMPKISTKNIFLKPAEEPIVSLPDEANKENQQSTTSPQVFSASQISLLSKELAANENDMQEHETQTNPKFSEFSLETIVLTESDYEEKILETIQMAAAEPTSSEYIQDVQSDIPRISNISAQNMPRSSKTSTYPLQVPMEQSRTASNQKITERSQDLTTTTSVLMDPEGKPLQGVLQSKKTSDSSSILKPKDISIPSRSVSTQTSLPEISFSSSSSVSGEYRVEIEEPLDKNHDQ